MSQFCSIGPPKGFVIDCTQRGRAATTGADQVTFDIDPTAQAATAG